MAIGGRAIEAKDYGDEEVIISGCNSTTGVSLTGTVNHPHRSRYILQTSGESVYCRIYNSYGKLNMTSRS